MLNILSLLEAAEAAAEAVEDEEEAVVEEVTEAEVVVVASCCCAAVLAAPVSEVKLAAVKLTAEADSCSAVAATASEDLRPLLHEVG